MSLRLMPLLIGFALVADPVVAADAPIPAPPAEPTDRQPAATETYRADARGELTIGPDGTVVRATFQSSGMDEHMRTAYVGQIAKWRFEPVLEDGAPVSVRVPFKLALRAVVDPATDKAWLHIDRAWFLSTASTPGAPPGGVQAELPPPRFPLKAYQAGAGARIMLMVELREKGRVARVAASDVVLLSAGPDEDTDRHVAAMVAAAEDAAASWRIPGFRAGARVRVPVVFKPDGMVWSRMHPYPYTPVDWVREAEAEDSPAAEALANGVGQLDGRIRLLTRLAGDAPAGGG